MSSRAPPPKKKCLTPKRKGILMGIVFGALVVGIALGIVVTLLIERCKSFENHFSMVMKVSSARCLLDSLCEHDDNNHNL